MPYQCHLDHQVDHYQLGKTSYMCRHFLTEVGIMRRIQDTTSLTVKRRFCLEDIWLKIGKATSPS